MTGRIDGTIRGREYGIKSGLKAVESVKGARDVRVEVVNVVATCKLPFKVNLETLAAMLPEQVRLNSRYLRHRLHT
jgi:TATA-box binding protein (TBP) (component of TFIID and TFIIIB)